MSLLFAEDISYDQKVKGDQGRQGEKVEERAEVQKSQGSGEGRGIRLHYPKGLCSRLLNSKKYAISL